MPFFKQDNNAICLHLFTDDRLPLAFDELKIPMSLKILGKSVGVMTKIALLQV